MISVEELINIKDENMFLLKRCAAGYIVGESYFSLVLSKKMLPFDKLCEQVKQSGQYLVDFTEDMVQIEVDKVLQIYKNFSELHYANIWYMSHSRDGILNFFDYDSPTAYTLDFLSSNYFWMDRKVYNKFFKNGSLK